mgnify:CR=1 FL=1
MIRKILIMSLVMLIVNCQTENEEIENVLVNFSINIQLPFYSSLSTVGNAIQINASENLGINGYCCGVKGIIITTIHQVSIWHMKEIVLFNQIILAHRLT